MKRLLLILSCLVGLSAYGQDTHIIPSPQQVEWQNGFFSWNEKSIHTSIVDHLDVPRNEDQAYRLTITQKSVVMEATTETGLFYAQQSLNQLYRYASLTGHEGTIQIPCMNILDWPDFKIRGWQDDISRGPIVRMEFLKELIPQLAECKLNAFSLYTEHTFRTKSHPDIAPPDAFTAEEIKELDAFCKQYHIELIGNQQCFAHFEEILKNPFYESLADAPDNLNPGIEATYEFLDDVIGEEAQAYSSSLFNINCDETESLGSGKAKAYVDSVGQTTAYYRHINRVNDIVKRHGKRTMMWGDIADQHPEILENLDKDIVLLAWNYAGRDDFNDFLRPYILSGHEFMVVPGVSLSERVSPKYNEFKRNIPNLCRDGFHAGAFGVINTCWDDFGESLTSSALYGLALGAEMSWNPTHGSLIPYNFCIHFFDNPDPVFRLYQALESASNLSEVDGLGRFSNLWEPMTPFYPSQVGDDVEAQQLELLNHWFRNGIHDEGIEGFLKHYRSTAQRHTYAIDNALYAVHRMKWCLNRNIARCQLYRTYSNPTEENIRESQRQLDSLVLGLHRLKQEYIPLWEHESRPCYLEVNLKKYDELYRQLRALPYLPFIGSGSDDGGRVTVTLRTIYNNQPIHYTLDGKEVTPSDPIYESPLTLTRSGEVRAACFTADGCAIQAERYILYHKGMGKLKALNSVPGNYRPEYSGGGDNALLDGLLGSNDYKDGHWQGFYGVDADIELDFKQQEDLHALEIGFLVNAHDWILRPNEVELYVSSNGNDYRLAATHAIHTQVASSGNFTFRECIPVDLRTRYLRIVVKNPGLIPEGWPGAGYESWIFMDEILIK